MDLEDIRSFLAKDLGNVIPPAIGYGVGYTVIVQGTTSQDPNALYGPAGYGSGNFLAASGTTFPYLIDFENSPTAGAPAQEVTIADNLDPNLNWTLPTHRRRIRR